jgi:hypothetical protein
MPEERSPWEDELTPEQLDRFLSLRDNPDDLLGHLREDVELTVALARADTRPVLRSWFSEMGIGRRPEGGWSHDPERTGAIGPNAVGIEWRWEGTHDDRGAGEGEGFNAIAPSDRDVTVRGFTLMGAEDGRFKVRRYIDWAGLFAQLGLTLNWRTPVASEPPGGREPGDEDV